MDGITAMGITTCIAMAPAATMAGIALIIAGGTSITATPPITGAGEPQSQTKTDGFAHDLSSGDSANNLGSAP